MDYLYCRCCLSTSAPLYKMLEDNLLIILYKELVGFKVEHEDLTLILCNLCKHFLLKISTFQDICKKANSIMKEYEKLEITNKSKIEACYNLPCNFHQLKCSGLQSVDIPAEDRLLIRRRPVNIVTLSRPETCPPNEDRELGQITLSIKNPVDINEGEDNQCDTEDLMFRSTDLNTTDEDNYFDFTIVVKDNVEDGSCSKCRMNDKRLTKVMPNLSLKSGEHSTNKSTDDDNLSLIECDGSVLYKTKNGVISLSLNEISLPAIKASTVTEKIDEGQSGEEFVLEESRCSDNEENHEGFEFKEEDNEEQFEDFDEIDQSFIENEDFTNEDTSTNISLLQNSKAEDLSNADIQQLSSVLSKARKSNLFRFTNVKHKRKIKMNNKHRNKTQYPCEVCGLVFDLAIHLEIHNSTHTGLNSFICDLCCRAFPLKSALEKHMSCHSCDRKRFKCDLCPKTFIFKKLLYKHKFKHTNEIKPHICSICSRGFVFENELKKHMLLHTDIRPFVCPKCPKKFTQKAFLSQHLLTHVEGELFICDICGKGFAQNAKLSYHRKTHLEVKPFQCDLCPRSFVRSGQLKTHKIYHSNERPWICEHCGRSFRVKGALTAHKRVHSGARPYKCDICHHSYTEAGYLKKHKRIHSGIKPFSCEICGRAFNETCTLARHRLTHSDERKHVCQECGGKFKYSGCLNKHIQRKHNTARATQS